MRNKAGICIIVFFISAVILMSYFNYDVENVIIISLIFIIIAFILLFESRSVDARTMALLATLSAIGGVLRVPLAVIPGFNPVTFICAVSGYSLGGINGFMVGSMCAFISNFFLGHGPWSLWQMLAWGLCGFFFGVFRGFIEKRGMIRFIILCTLWGYIYGNIMNQWYIVSYIRPITIKAIVAGSAASLWHDSLHALGNMIFATIFGKSFIEVLDRYKRKNNIEYIDV